MVLLATFFKESFMKSMWLHAMLTELQCELIDWVIDSLADEPVVL